MRHDTGPLCVGVLTSDPVACRALRLLLRSAGYTIECLRSTDGLDGVDLLVVGPGIGDGRDQRAPSSDGGPILYLAADGEDVAARREVCLPWPVPSSELVRAIQVAMGAAHRYV